MSAPSPIPSTPPPDCLPRGEWISLSTAASPEYSGLALKTLRRRIGDGTLRAYKVAGTRAIRVNTDDLDALFTPVNGHGEVGMSTSDDMPHVCQEGRDAFGLQFENVAPAQIIQCLPEPSSDMCCSSHCRQRAYLRHKRAAK
jgi:excisionase family DNA binding protein